MPQDTPHRDYTRLLPQWERCQDAVQGTDAVKARGERYLPRPSGMTPAEYQAYKHRAKWFNATARVRDGLLGILLRKPPLLTGPEALAAQTTDITRTGVSLRDLTACLLGHYLVSGHAGVLVDLHATPSGAVSVRPHWTLYQPAQIVNWRLGVTPRGQVVPVQVVLHEVQEVPDPRDPYASVEAHRWRELALIEGVYTVQVWRKDEQGRFVLAEEPRIPQRRGQPLPFLPFALWRAPGPPPLLDLADLNYDHYRTSADYKHELHLTSLATAYITGWDNLEAEMKVGALAAWVIPPPDAKVGYLEVQGRGLQAKLDDMTATEGQMAVLGARLLEPQKRAAEAAETHALRQAGELSILEQYGQHASTLLTQCLRWHAWWAGVTEAVDDPTIAYALDPDLTPTRLAPQDLLALVAAWERGALTEQDLYYNLRQGELTEPGEDFATWQQGLMRGATLARNGGL